jgi:hypothetical protein
VDLKDCRQAIEAKYNLPAGTEHTIQDSGERLAVRALIYLKAMALVLEVGDIFYHGPQNKNTASC